ncbi:hypothetical protein BDR04DRAFT_275765 [Suillus decipiens]|nr:hypothetical protein BDR04DRAFT_275765 [Suillus decipiens]
MDFTCMVIHSATPLTQSAFGVTGGLVCVSYFGRRGRHVLHSNERIPLDRISGVNTLCVLHYFVPCFVEANDRTTFN